VTSGIPNDGPARDDDALEAEQAESLRRIEAGGIPVSSERRLRAAGSTVGGAFTSDLSVGGFALCDHLQLQPLAQVMGSSVYQMGAQYGSWGSGWWESIGTGGTFMVELDTYTQALNEVRTRALDRLAEEARQVGADAVVGVSTQAGESDLGSGSLALEHSVFGTAVARRDLDPAATRAAPVLSELSVADFSQLLRGGFEPAGIVAWSSVYFAGYAYGPGIAMGEAMLGPIQTFELREFTQAFYEAREAVMERLGHQADGLRASGIVGVRISHRATRQTIPARQGNRERNGLMVTFHAIGTAIREREAASLYAPETTVDLTM
jgi:uncharacterized protein YbjQ (UPF0145 family)